MQGHRSQDAEVAALLAALERALDTGAELLDVSTVARTRQALDRATRRMQVGREQTVVALVGATGSGKSTLFNALAGMEIAEVGTRRPLTTEPMACIWGDESADALLDWLGISPERRLRRETVLDADHQAALHGLVLLDMPDHDSTELAHRLEVDRLVDLVDLLVWVVDPQKYADEALHSGYLQRLTGHDAVMIVVLNQIDRLDTESAASCLLDLRRMLDDDGLESVRMVALSARDGLGVDELREMLEDSVQERSAVGERAAADLQLVAEELTTGVAPAEPGGGRTPGTDVLRDEMADAVAIPAILDAATADYQRQGRSRTAWPPLLARSRRESRNAPSLAGRLGADGPRPDGTVRTGSAQRSQVDLAVTTFVSRIAGALPLRWARAVRLAVAQPDRDVVAELDDRLSAVDLRVERPAWWKAAQAAHYLLLALAVLGSGWSLAAALVWLAGGTPGTGRSVGGVALPVVLLLVGLVLGLLLAVVSSAVIGAAARRRRALLEDQLRTAVQDVAQRLVVDPVEGVLARHRTTREALSAVDAKAVAESVSRADHEEAGRDAGDEVVAAQEARRARPAAPPAGSTAATTPPGTAAPVPVTTPASITPVRQT